MFHKKINNYIIFLLIFTPLSTQLDPNVNSENSGVENVNSQDSSVKLEALQDSHKKDQTLEVVTLTQRTENDLNRYWKYIKNFGSSALNKTKNGLTNAGNLSVAAGKGSLNTSKKTINYVKSLFSPKKSQELIDRDAVLTMILALHKSSTMETTDAQKSLDNLNISLTPCKNILDLNEFNFNIPAHSNSANTNIKKMAENQKKLMTPSEYVVCKKNETDPIILNCIAQAMKARLDFTKENEETDKKTKK